MVQLRLSYPSMTEGHTEGNHRAEPVTVSQAAKILHVHRNTVHNYIQQGRLKASKVMDGGREYYLIDRDSLPNVHKGNHEHTLDAQAPAEHNEIAVLLAHRLEDLVQRYGQELGSVREELGAERVRREFAEEKVARLEAELEALRDIRKALTGTRVGPETTSETTQGIDTLTDQGQAETGVQRRSSWWRRFFGFE